jgi:guanylate kinase
MGEWDNNHYNGWLAWRNESKTSGTVVAIFGPTASGKSVARDVFVDEQWDKIVSYTTRPPRPGSTEEQDGEYEFISQDEFNSLQGQDRLLNVNASYAGNAYGTDKEKIKDSPRAIMITDYTAIPQLHREVGRLGKKMVAVYVTAPPEELLHRQARRLETGEYEDREQLKKRMAELRNEIEKETKIKSLADYIIMEEDIPATIERAKELANQIQ